MAGIEILKRRGLHTNERALWSDKYLLNYGGPSDEVGFGASDFDNPNVTQSGNTVQDWNKATQTWVAG